MEDKIMCVAENLFFREERHKPLNQRDRITGPECSNSYIIVTKDL